MLQTIDLHALSWHCQGDEETPCNTVCTCTLEEVEWSAEQTITIIDAETEYALQSSPDGAVMVLPACPCCEARLWLKADYKRADFRKRTLFVEHRDAQNVVQFRTLRPDHTRNLVLHHLLYQRGHAPAPPILPMLPREELEQPVMELGLTASLWFTFHLLTGSTDSTHFEHYFLETINANKRISASKQQAISSPTEKKESARD